MEEIVFNIITDNLHRISREVMKQFIDEVLEIAFQNTNFETLEEFQSMKDRVYERMLKAKEEE